MRNEDVDKIKNKVNLDMGRDIPVSSKDEDMGGFIMNASTITKRLNRAIIKGINHHCFGKQIEK